MLLQMVVYTRRKVSNLQILPRDSQNRRPVSNRAVETYGHTLNIVSLDDSRDSLAAVCPFNMEGSYRARIISNVS